MYFKSYKQRKVEIKKYHTISEDAQLQYLDVSEVMGAKRAHTRQSNKSKNTDTQRRKVQSSSMASEPLAVYSSRAAQMMYRTEPEHKTPYKNHQSNMDLYDSEMYPRRVCNYLF